MDTELQLQYVLNVLNNIHLKIKFSVEFEDNNRNFLDLNINWEDSTVTFNIFENQLPLDIYNFIYYINHTLATYNNSFPSDTIDKIVKTVERKKENKKKEKQKWMWIVFLHL